MAARAPAGLGKAGRALWRQITATYDLDAAERPLVEQACQLADRVAELEDQIATDGLMVAGSTGQPRLHPAVAEARQTRVALARCLGQVAFPDEQGRPMTASSVHAQGAAVIRWRGAPRGA